MKTKIGVITDNTGLWQKIRLALRGTHEVIRISGTVTGHGCALVLRDLDTRAEGDAGDVLMGRGLAYSHTTLPLPFEYSELYALIESTQPQEEECITLYRDERICYLGERQIKLTDVEMRLLKMLMSSPDFTDRDTLLLGVWGEGADPGVLNVYVHYLREKLEKEGKKVILSSRKEGYRINQSYRRKIC